MKRPQPDRFYTVAEVAEMLSLSVKTVRRRIDDGSLRSHKFGAQIRISEGDYNAYVAQRRVWALVSIEGH